MGIEVIETNKGLCLSQRNDCLDLLSEFGLLACKPTAFPIDQSLDISNEPSLTDLVLDKLLSIKSLLENLYI